MTNGVASEFAPRRSGAEVGANIKLYVTNDGLYRVTLPLLTNIGVAASNIIGSQMRLFYRTQEVAVYVSNTNQWTSDNDYLLFYGQGYDGLYSRSNVYWLGFGHGGRRMPSLAVTPLQGLPVVTTAVSTVTYKPRMLYQEQFRTSDDTLDHWFAFVASHTQTVRIAMDTEGVIRGGTATFSARLYGSWTVSHGTDISVNGTNIGFWAYAGTEEMNVSTNFPAAYMNSVSTVGVYQVLETNNDFAFAKEITLSYQRALRTLSPRIVFPGAAGSNTYEVLFSTTATNMVLLDISDPSSPAWLTGSVVTNLDATNRLVRFSGDTGGRRYFVGTTNGIWNVPAAGRAFFRGLGATNIQADYVVICPYAFRQEVYQLLKRRYQQGLRVVVAPVPDIYNEFSYGVPDAGAIKQLIGYARYRWAVPPTYVLLAGSGSYDPLNIEGAGAPENVPVHLGPSPGRWTSEDGWYGQVVEAVGPPDVLLGRIPARTVAEFKAVVDKIVAFEGRTNDAARSQTLLVADKTDGVYNFKAYSEEFRTNVLVPSGVLTNIALYHDEITSATAMRNDITSELENGVLAMTYIGHGSFDNWSYSDFFNTNDVLSLANDFCPIAMLFTCRNGYCHHTIREYMAQAFLNSSHGAVAVLASSWDTYPEFSQAVGGGFCGSMFGERVPRLGDALSGLYTSLIADQGSNTVNVLCFELFGDPAMVVNP